MSREYTQFRSERAPRAGQLIPRFLSPRDSSRRPAVIMLENAAQPLAAANFAAVQERRCRIVLRRNHLVQEFLEHYHTERPHQAKGNRLLAASATDPDAFPPTR